MVWPPVSTTQKGRTAAVEAKLIRGDLSVSISQHESVGHLIAGRLPGTLLLLGRGSFFHPLQLLRRLGRGLAPQQSRRKAPACGEHGRFGNPDLRLCELVTLARCSAPGALRQMLPERRHPSPACRAGRGPRWPRLRGELRGESGPRSMADVLAAAADRQRERSGAMARSVRASAPVSPALRPQLPQHVAAN